MDVDRYGNFSLTVGSDKLSKGLRPSKRSPRNSDYLITAQGVVGKDGVLQVLDTLTRLATAAITDGFPYPQIFVFINVIIICSSTEIYEWVNNALVLKKTVTAGRTWSAIDFYDYILLTNGIVGVYRDSMSKVYTLSTNYGTALCNFNGQVIVGAPSVNWVEE